MNDHHLQGKDNIKKDNHSRLINNLYGILAVIFVLIPEWMAEFTLSINKEEFNDNQISIKKYSRINPYYFVSTMTTKELRALARELKINGYSADTHLLLQRRILKRLKIRKFMKSPNQHRNEPA